MTTIAELTAIGVPAILIPLPTATDDHQRKNAEATEAAGAADTLLQSSATGAELARRILALAADAPRRARMSAAAKLLARPDAARVIADKVMELRCSAQADEVRLLGIGRARRRRESTSGAAGESRLRGHGIGRETFERDEAARDARHYGRRRTCGRQRGTADVVVISSAVRPSNAEVVEAARRRNPGDSAGGNARGADAPAIRDCGRGGPRQDDDDIDDRARVERAGLDPTAVIGGRLSAFGSNARLGGGGVMVAEADESDRSFLKLFPTLAVITNIDREHLAKATADSPTCSRPLDFANKVPLRGRRGVRGQSKIVGGRAEDNG